LVEFSQRDNVRGADSVIAFTIRGEYENSNSVELTLALVVGPEGLVRLSPALGPGPVKNRVLLTTGIELSPWATFPISRVMTARSSRTATKEVELCFNRRVKYGRLVLKASRKTKTEFDIEEENQRVWGKSLGYALPMRKTEVPQLGQTPLMAGFPFLSVTFWGFFISMLVLHFTQ